MDIGKSVIVCSLLSVLFSFVLWATKILIQELIRAHKHHKYKDRFPEIIVDDGYGDIHRTIYPNELLAIKLFSTCYRDLPIFAETMNNYIRGEIQRAKACRNVHKRRKYELITILNAITIIRRECDGLGNIRK